MSFGPTLLESQFMNTLVGRGISTTSQTVLMILNTGVTSRSPRGRFPACTSRTGVLPLIPTIMTGKIMLAAVPERSLAEGP